jgi:hypothetical protein
MAAGATYTQIATRTLESNTSGVIFSSISAAYTDLVLVFKGGITNNMWDMVARVNSDAGTNYSGTSMFSETGSAYSVRNTNSVYMRVAGFGAGTPANNLSLMAIINFMNYSNTTTNKTIMSRGGSTTTTGAIVSLWRSTAAINSISLFTSATNNGTTDLYAGSVISLYGITAA